MINTAIIPGILGSSPHMSRDDAMRRLVRQAHGAPAEFTSNPASEYSRHHREGAIIEAEMLTGYSVMRDDKPFVRGGHAALFAGWINSETIADVYCPFALRAERAPVFKPVEDIPHVIDRVQYNLWVTEADTCLLFMWAPAGADFVFIDADQAWRDEALPRIAAFADDMAIEIANPKRHLRPVVPDMRTAEVLALLDEYDQLSEAIDQADARRTEILDRLGTLSRDGKRTLNGRQIAKSNSTNYAKALSHYAPDADLEPFRIDRTSWHLEGGRE